MPVVNVPGIGTVNFPDSMSEAEITAALKKMTAPPERTPVRDQVPEELLSPLPTGGELSSLRRILSMGDPALTGEPPPDVVSRESVAPTVGGLAGRMIGTRLGSPMLGEAGGAMAGEGVNQMLGVTEPSLKDILLAGGLSLAGDVVGKGVTAGLRRLPGAPAVLHEAAAEKLPAIATRHAPAQTAESLYAIVRRQNPPIPIGRLHGAVLKVKNELAAPLSKAGEDSQLRTLVNDIEREIVTTPGQELPFERLWATQKRISDMIDATETKGGQAHGALELLKKSINESFNQAAAVGNPALPAVAALRAANAANAREGVVKDLTKLFSEEGAGIGIRSDIGTMGTGGPQLEIRPNSLLKQIGKSDIKKFLPPGEYEALRRDLTEMGKELPALGAMRGADAGSKLRIGRIAGSGATGTLIGALTGADPSTAALIGGSVGTLIGAWAPEIIAKAVVSPPGRALLRRLTQQGGGRLTQAGLATLAVAVGMTDPGKGAITLGPIGQTVGPLIEGLTPGGGY